MLQLELTKDGIDYSQSKEFTWGVLAINVNKSIYLSNEDSFIKELEKAILYVRRDQVRMKLRDISTKIHTEAEGSLTIEKLNQEFTDLSRTLKQLGAT